MEGRFLSIYESPIGPLYLVSDGDSLTGLQFELDDRENYNDGSDLPVMKKTMEWLEIYFSGRDPGFLPKLRLSGSEFLQMVGRIMLEVPFGQTITYGDIARKVMMLTGKARMSAQAVGGAVGHNPIAIIIPCHRVIGVGGKLTGYGGGLDKKVLLLENEGLRF